MSRRSSATDLCGVLIARKYIQITHSYTHKIHKCESEMILFIFSSIAEFDEGFILKEETKRALVVWTLN